MLGKINTMLRILFLAVSLFFILHSAGQVKLNLSLKKELDSIYRLHNTTNLVLGKDAEVKADSIMKINRLKNPIELFGYLNNLQKQYDSSNFLRIKIIINQYGYPGKSLVGSPTNEVAFFVIQKYLNSHPDELPVYLAILKNAADSNDLPFNLYANILDKSLLEQGQERIYGTQTMAVCYSLGNSGLNGIKWVVWPIKDAETVNERRKNIGISETVEEMAQKQNFTYRVYTLEEIKALKRN